MAGDILGMDVIGGGEGLPHSLCYLYCFVFQYERFLQVYDFSPFHRLFYYFPVACGIVVSLRFDHRLGQREYVFLE